MRRRTKELNRWPGKEQAQAKVQDGFSKIRALTQLEIIPQRLRGQDYGFIADQKQYGKARKSSRNRYTQT